MYAVNAKKGLELIKYLIERGVDVNLKNSTSSTALLMACHWGKTEIVDCLINEGKAIMDTVSDWGMIINPLSAAMVERNKEIVKILLRKGADINLA